MTDEVWTYFKERYEKASFRVVQGHWPDFKGKEQVDKWFALTEKITRSAFEDFVDEA